MDEPKSGAALRDEYAQDCLDDATALDRANTAVGVIGGFCAIVGLIIGILAVGSESLRVVGLILLVAGLWTGLTSWLGVALCRAVASRVALAGAVALAQGERSTGRTDDDTGPIPTVR